MKSQHLSAAVEEPLEGEIASMEDIWAAAEKDFESICGKSLGRGDVKTFDDLQKKIENADKDKDGEGRKDREKREKAKGMALKTLKVLKILIDTASSAASALPIPSAASSFACNALSFVFDIPEHIKNYNEAVGDVFTEVYSALSQFQIYQSVDKSYHLEPRLLRHIHLAVASFVKICAHVVKYQQGHWRTRLMQQIKSIFGDDSGLASEIKEFKLRLKQQKDVEGTVTLAVVVESQHDISVVRKTTDTTLQVSQEVQKGVRALKDHTDREETLKKIGDALELDLDSSTAQTYKTVHKRLIERMGEWIWTHDAYATWTAPKDRETSHTHPHVLLITGPACSGKTSATALITKRLEERKERIYVANYCFPAGVNKLDHEKNPAPLDHKKNPVPLALKDMAFQIARVDVTVRKALGSSCEAGPIAFRQSASLENLDKLWSELKIGASSATYYLVFDGLENLDDKQAKMLTTFIFGPKLASPELAGRIRVLASGTDKQFDSIPSSIVPLKISMEQCNKLDMKIMIEETLNDRGILRDPLADPDQKLARDKIIEKLPQNARGSYNLLKIGLDEVIRLLSARSTVQQLEHALEHTLDHSVSGLEEVIKDLQRSLTGDEINELNNLLKWVLFGMESMTLQQLDGAMSLDSGTKSLVSLEYIIKTRYSDVLEVEGKIVNAKGGVEDYLRNKPTASARASHPSKESPTISMTITINNVDQQTCTDFLWNLAYRASRDKFEFNFDAASIRSAAIVVDEFEAHRTIVMLALKCLSQEHEDQTKDISRYLVYWLPYHLTRLRALERTEERGLLTHGEKMKIGLSLYQLFKDQDVFRRHRTSFEQSYWTAEEMKNLQEWLMDSAVMRTEWRNELKVSSITKGFMKALVTIIVEGFLRERNRDACWDVRNAFDWIIEFMDAGQDSEEPQKFSQPSDVDSDLNRMNVWCQSFLGLSDSELDSLWYERLAEASAAVYGAPTITQSLYEQAIEKEPHSWLCHRGLGKMYFDEGRAREAITQMEKALEEAEGEGATPEPKPTDKLELHLLLGRYIYGTGDVEAAAMHYSSACASEDIVQANEGRLGVFKTKLSILDTEGTRQLLRTRLALEDGEESMAKDLKMLAQDTDHDSLLSKILAGATRDTDLLKSIVRAMEKATSMSTPDETRTVHAPAISPFIEREAHGVLLYDRGVAAYTYSVSADGTEPVNEALRLWHDSRKILSSVPASAKNASSVLQDATSSLAKHYFQSVVEKKNIGDISALEKLAEAEHALEADTYNSPSIGFLGALHAVRGKKELSRAVLVGRIRLALQVLSDDTPDNDVFGFLNMFLTLSLHQDFRNAGAALSLSGQPDIVAGALHFEAGDVTEDESVDRQRVLRRVSELAEEIVRVMKVKVPDAKQQLQRIQAAKAYIDILSTAEGEPEANSDHLYSADIETAAAHRILHARLSSLQQTITEQSISTFSWWGCDGLESNGKKCAKGSNFERDFYHCVYCWPSRDFCSGCLARLRHPDTEVKITVCSAQHRWLRIPPQGGDVYVGARATSVRVPSGSGMRAVEGDDRILEIVFDDGKECTVQEWMEELAREWGISREEIGGQISSQLAPEKVEGDEQQGEGQKGDGEDLQSSL